MKVRHWSSEIDGTSAAKIGTQVREAHPGWLYVFWAYVCIGPKVAQIGANDAMLTGKYDVSGYSPSLATRTCRSGDARRARRGCGGIGGGAYVGYIDRPTRETVANILAEKLTPSGTDDNQLPALATLPAVVGVLHGQSAMDAAVDDAVSVTHTDAGTLAYCKMFAGLLEDVLDGTKVPVALRRAADGASGDMGDLLRAALGSSETDSVRYGETTGLTCYLHEGLPLAFHIMNNATDFADAVERNIRAGGDSCGRAIAIGAVMGAQAGVVGLPFPWVNLLDGNAKLFAQARRLTAEG